MDNIIGDGVNGDGPGPVGDPGGPSSVDVGVVEVGEVGAGEVGLGVDGKGDGSNYDNDPTLYILYNNYGIMVHLFDMNHI